jgi:hypothetical protein
VEFRADGTFTELQIGRGDAQSPGPTGRWDASGRLTRPTAVGTATGGTTTGGTSADDTAMGSTAGRIASVAADRLEIAWG